MDDTSQHVHYGRMHFAYRETFKMNYNKTSRIVNFIQATVIIVMLLMFALYVTLGASLLKGCSHVSEKGLKHTIDEIWNGKENLTN